MWSWLPTQASPDVSLRVTLDRDRLADLLAPTAMVDGEAVLDVTSDNLVIRAADAAHTRSVTATLAADACSQYAVTPGRLVFDPTTLRAAIAADQTVSTETESVTLTYAAGESTLSVALSTLTQEQSVDPTPEDDVPLLNQWPGGATVHHRAKALTELCSYFAARTNVVTVEYDGSQNLFRIESVTAQSADDASAMTSTYERAGSELPGETAAVTVKSTFDSALLRDLTAAVPGDARVRLDIADAHPLRLAWTGSHTDNEVDTPVEITALLAPRETSVQDDDETG